MRADSRAALRILRSESPPASKVDRGYTAVAVVLSSWNRVDITQQDENVGENKWIPSIYDRTRHEKVSH